MPKLVWDSLNDRRYDIGVDRGVFYPAARPGLVWNGLVSVQESPSDSERTRYIDGVKTHSGRRTESFSGAIEAMTYPDEFNEHVLIPRHPKPFGFSYRTKTENSYKIHLVYNVSLAPTSYTYARDEAVDPFSWEFETLPMPIPGFRPSAHLFIDAETAYSGALSAIEDVLYGDLYYNPRLPSPTEVVDIFAQFSS